MKSPNIFHDKSLDDWIMRIDGDANLHVRLNLMHNAHWPAINRVES